MSEIPTPQEFASKIKRRTYSAILELSARHPLLNAGDIALMTGASEPWVKKLMSSDAFRAQRAQMVEKLHGPRLEEIRGKMEATLSNVIEAINKRIADPTADCTEDTLLKAFTLLADRIVPPKVQALAPPNPGNAPPAGNTIIFNGISLEDIENARRAAYERSRTLELEPQHHEQVIDVDADGLPAPRRIRSNEGID